MKILLKSAKIFDSNSAFHGKVADIFIENGIIKKIGEKLNEKADEVIEHPDLSVSPGWFDSSVCFGEPGFEERETIANGLETAAKSGFTAVALNPNTFPVLDNNAAVNSVKAKASGHPVSLYPVGNVSLGNKGVDLSEMLDMKEGGAISFYDYKNPIANPNLLKIALQYAQNFDALIQSFPLEKKISGKAEVNEHHNSTLLGLKGMPNLAEELQVSRDLFLLEYTGGKLHIPTISTAKSVELIKKAKKQGLDVSCSVAIHNLFYTDEKLLEFDSNAKVLPPLRTSEDIKALRKALKDGTIDMVTSDHNPMDEEHKKVEFDNAAFGSIGLESIFGALCRIFSAEEAAGILARGRERFGLEKVSIAEGSEINLSLFIEEEYQFEKKHILSSSQNSIFLGEKLSGKALGIITKNGFILS